VNPKINEVPLGLNPVEEVIKIYKTGGPGTNQATMEVGMPQDIVNPDPPCLRLIDTRVRYGKLHFVVYFRSWDLWAGFPANLAGIQQLKEYMAAQIGVEERDRRFRPCTFMITPGTWPNCACRYNSEPFCHRGLENTENIM
jgi:hypothetical protein